MELIFGNEPPRTEADKKLIELGFHEACCEANRNRYEHEVDDTGFFIDPRCGFCEFYGGEFEPDVIHALSEKLKEMGF